MDIEFDLKLAGFIADFKDLKEKETDLKGRMGLVNERFGGWLKELGLPENFALVDLMDITRNKARGQ